MRGSGKERRPNTDITSPHCQRIATKCPVIWSLTSIISCQFLKWVKTFRLLCVRISVLLLVFFWATKLRGIGKRRERFGREIIKVGENGICEEKGVRKYRKYNGDGEELSGNDWRKWIEKEKEYKNKYTGRK